MEESRSSLQASTPWFRLTSGHESLGDGNAALASPPTSMGRKPVELVNHPESGR
jgi:hypothetical protein